MTILERFKNGEFAITDSTWELVDYLHDNDSCSYEGYMVDTTLTHVDVDRECIKSVMHGKNSANLPTMTAQRFLQLVEEEGEEDLSPVKIRILNEGITLLDKDEIVEITDKEAVSSINKEIWHGYLSEEGNSLLEKWDNFWDGYGLEYEVIKDDDDFVIKIDKIEKRYRNRFVECELSYNQLRVRVNFEDNYIDWLPTSIDKTHIKDLIKILQEAEKEFEING